MKLSNINIAFFSLLSFTIEKFVMRISNSWNPFCKETLRTAFNLETISWFHSNQIWNKNNIATKSVFIVTTEQWQLWCAVYGFCECEIYQTSIVCFKMRCLNHRYLNGYYCDIKRNIFYPRITNSEIENKLQEHTNERSYFSWTTFLVKTSFTFFSVVRFHFHLPFILLCIKKGLNLL